MYKYPLIAFALFFSTLLNADPTYGSFFEAYPEFVKTIVGFSYCDDREIFEFNGDITVLLDDGSEWKVHPDSQNLVNRWQPGDQVQIEPRTSHYWFKREHKFRLVNLDRARKSVKVMYTQEPMNPLFIVATETYVAYTILIPYSWQDEEGNWHTIWTEEPVWEKALMISDGTLWHIRNNFGDFIPYQRVYFGVKTNSSGDFDSASTIIISGSKLDATFSYCW